LFRYLKEDKELDLIKSCVFHYELEFIHPFLDGNGRMGRLWQTVILKEKYPVFESLPFETLISKTQNDYYQALAVSDKSGKSTVFIEYMLQIIDQALNNLLKNQGKPMSSEDRITYFLSLGKNQFTRKEYMGVFKSISTATASRDLKKAVENGMLETEESGNKTKYLNISSLPKTP
jgi:Fic family protein